MYITLHGIYPPFIQITHPAVSEFVVLCDHIASQVNGCVRSFTYDYGSYVLEVDSQQTADAIAALVDHINTIRHQLVNSTI
jgi:hypothetical protein